MPTVEFSVNTTFLSRNRLVDPRATVDDHTVEQNRIDDLRPRMDAHVRRQDGMVHLAAGNDDAGGDDRIGGMAQAVAAGMHELRRAAGCRTACR